MLVIICLQFVVIVLLAFCFYRSRMKIRNLHQSMALSPSAAAPEVVEEGEDGECPRPLLPDDPEVDWADLNAADSGVDKELFEQVHRTIVEKKLFLDPDFSRDNVIRIGLINKNKVAQMFREHAHTNLTGYINALRLEYAMDLMKQQPDIPIKAVAYDAGFNSVRTFYRIFEKAYGLTPTDWKDRRAKEMRAKEIKTGQNHGLANS